MSDKQTLPAIEHAAGADFDLPMLFSEPDGSPLNLTGATVFLTVKVKQDASVADASAVLKKDVTTHTDATAGKTNVAISKSDTIAIAPRNYAYEILIVDAGLRRLPIGIGAWIITPTLTNRA